MLRDVIAMAAGRREADLLFTNARLLNLFSGEVETTHVAVGHGVIVGIGPMYRRSRQVYDLAGKYLLPGFIDGHVHLESSLLSPARYAEAVVPHGTTTVVADPARDLLKLVVVERHRETGNIGLGLVSGFGLQVGALASSVAHDSHNLIAVGVEDRDLLCALQEVTRMGGGLAACAGGRVLSSLPLPIGGLMTDAPLSQVGADFQALHRSAQALGTPLARPWMALSFLALPVIPELRLTDRGLVDVEHASMIPLHVA